MPRQAPPLGTPRAWFAPRDPNKLYLPVLPKTPAAAPAVGVPPEAAEWAKRLGLAAERAGADVLIDDRAERPGVKFKDADLVGIPLRITVGGKGLKEGIIELKWRSQKEVSRIALNEAEARIASAVAEAAGRAGMA